MSFDALLCLLSYYSLFIIYLFYSSNYSYIFSIFLGLYLRLRSFVLLILISVITHGCLLNVSYTFSDTWTSFQYTFINQSSIFDGLLSFLISFGHSKCPLVVLSMECVILSGTSSSLFPCLSNKFIYYRLLRGKTQPTLICPYISYFKKFVKVGFLKCFCH